MKRPHKKNNNLTHTEILLFRSYAIGMGKDGVQDLLNINDKDYEKIEESLFRKFHVNNAYYAYVAAVRNDEIVEALTFFDRYRVSPKFQFPVPNAKFRDEVEYHLNSICTSYAPNKKFISHRKLSSYGYSGKHLGVAVRGALHKETIYAKRKAPGESQFSCHIRKPIESFQTKVQVGKIVDPVIKQCIEKAIAKGGGYINEKVPIQALIERDYK